MAINFKVKGKTMKNWILFVLLILTTSSGFAWNNYNAPITPIPYFRPVEDETQSKLDEMEMRLNRSEAEVEQELEEQKSQIEDDTQQITEELEEKIKQAEDRIDNLESRVDLYKDNNSNFLSGIFILALAGLTLYKIRKDKRQNEGDILNQHEKAGVVIALVGVMIAISALFVSSPWSPTLDIWLNLMENPIIEVMHISIWPYTISPKYVLLSCIALILYGIMVYLEIVRAPKLLISKLGK